MLLSRNVGTIGVGLLRLGGHFGEGGGSLSMWFLVRVPRESASRTKDQRTKSKEQHSISKNYLVYLPTSLVSSLGTPAPACLPASLFLVYVSPKLVVTGTPRHPLPQKKRTLWRLFSRRVLLLLLLPRPPTPPEPAWLPLPAMVVVLVVVAPARRSRSSGAAQPSPPGNASRCSSSSARCARPPPISPSRR